MYKPSRPFLRVMSITLSVVLCLSLSAWVTGFEDDYFKISKSLELFGQVFREISENYVDDVEPEEIVKAGIDGMLTTLDPYTILMDQSSSDDFDALTTGAYVGFGIGVSVRDSMLTIISLTEGYPAQRAGVRIGDRLVAIDTVPTLAMTSKELRKYTRGERGSTAILKVLRDGIRDTLNFSCKREEIGLKTVTYFGKDSLGIGTITLERFARRSVQEIRDALDSLQSNGKLKGIILDLRSNPGGLLDAAVNICELFVKQGSIIVSTKRKNGTDVVYKSRSIPYIDSNIPLAVIINNNSASASEIVAGCIQDNDRGIIVGETSFGKGLVQSVFPLPFNNTLKVTTSRYYTPSGRSIQKIDYEKRRKHLVSLAQKPSTFYSTNKRPFKDGTGIEPDSTIPENEYSSYVNELLKTNAHFRFVNLYTARLKSLPQALQIQAILDQFEKYLQTDFKFTYQSPVIKELQSLAKTIEKEKYSQQTVSSLQQAIQAAQIDQNRQFKVHSDEIKLVLEREIRLRFLPLSAVTLFDVAVDKQLKKTSDLLLSTNYKKILLTTTTIDNTKQ